VRGEGRRVFRWGKGVWMALIIAFSQIVNGRVVRYAACILSSSHFLTYFVFYVI